MTTTTHTSGPVVGKLGAVFGALAVAATVWLAVLSFTSFNPPDVVRFVGAIFLPIGVGGAILVGLVVMQFAAGY